MYFESCKYVDTEDKYGKIFKAVKLFSTHSHSQHLVMVKLKLHPGLESSDFTHNMFIYL